MFLFGGNDCANTVIPYDQAGYDAYVMGREGSLARPLGVTRLRSELLEEREVSEKIKADLAEVRASVEDALDRVARQIEIDMTDHHGSHSDNPRCISHHLAHRNPLRYEVVLSVDEVPSLFSLNASEVLSLALMVMVKLVLEVMSTFGVLVRV